ncbi:MAG: replication initiator protein [Microvirus sp.]|nr:MAG: replication initiator protein [Microvirus sp.]
MPCYRPLPGLDTGAIRVDTQKRIIKILPRSAWHDYNYKTDQLVRKPYMTIPCGQCIGCRLQRSLHWAVRCQHEASLYQNNCFITLTYNNQHLPQGGTLIKADFQKFMKRLRKCYGEGIRYYMCGEYGSEYSRPHYHALLFNFNFSDREYWKRSGSGEKLYVSQNLDKLWTKPETGKSMGYSSIGNATFESAAYVARYITKKKFGEQALTAYTDFDPWTGEILCERLPEYNTMSRRPGIAAGWFDQNFNDVYSGDFVLRKKKDGTLIKMSPPKFYDSRYELTDPEDLKKIKENRKNNAAKHKDNNTFDRLAIREEIQEIKAKQLIRSYEK